MQNRQNPQKHKGYSPWVLSCPVSCIQDVLETTKHKRRKTSKPPLGSQCCIVFDVLHIAHVSPRAQCCRKGRVLCVSGSAKATKGIIRITCTLTLVSCSRHQKAGFGTRVPFAHAFRESIHSVDSARTRCMTRSGIGATPFDSTDADGAGAGLRYSHNNQQGPA